MPRLRRIRPDSCLQIALARIEADTANSGGMRTVCAKVPATGEMWCDHFAQGGRSDATYRVRADALWSAAGIVEGSGHSMSGIRIAIGSDHAGFRLKEALKRWIATAGHVAIDVGTDGGESVDYPDFGYAVADAVASGECDRGVVICGTGIGISIAANRRPSIRAALCHDAATARLAREHNDANVLALGARVIDEDTARECLAVFLTTGYEGGRHDRRVAKLSSDQRTQKGVIERVDQ